LALLLAIALAAAPSWAQPAAPTPPPPTPPPPTSTATNPIPSSCLKKDKPAPAATSTIGPPPVTWNEFEIEGERRDPPATGRALFTPVMTRRTSLTSDARTDVAATAARYGYYVVGLGTRETAKGNHAIIHVAPLPLVRKVNIDIKQSPFATLLDDQV